MCYVALSLCCFVASSLAIKELGSDQAKIYSVVCSWISVLLVLILVLSFGLGLGLSFSLSFEPLTRLVAAALVVLGCPMTPCPKERDMSAVRWPVLNYGRGRPRPRNLYSLVVVAVFVCLGQAQVDD